MTGKIAIEDNNRPYCEDCDKWMGRNGKAESGNIRYKCSGCGVRTTATSKNEYANSDIGYDTHAVGEYTRLIREAIKKGANRFVITSAVNNCPVNTKAFNSLQRLCKDRQAHLLVIPIHYKNVSLYTASQEYTKWWASAVRPYIIDGAVALGNRVWVRGDIKIQATAADPLSGMAPLTGYRWSIFGHSQMGMEPIATPSEELPGRMYSSGAITSKSYSKTKIGAKAGFHHVTGALYVEISGKKAFIRHLNADSDGAIYDLTDCYSGEVHYTNQKALSITTGDEHVKWMLDNVRTATYTHPKSLVNTLKPAYIVRHDVLDGYAGSHHHIDHFTTEYKKWYHGDSNYQTELDQVVEHINDTTPTAWKCTNVLVKDSNHHAHLDSWLERADDRLDHLNADLICTLRNAQREAIRDGKDYSAFRLYLEPRLTVPTVFTDPQSSYMLGGVDFAHHGHRGANGSRGSARGFANTTHKATIGHTHSARVVKSVHQVGKSCGTLEYEGGLSSHTNTHSLQYTNGKRTPIDILGVHWHANNEPHTGGLEIT